MDRENKLSKVASENVILIGMFGSGKSTIGRLLAEKLRYYFLDVDQLIESHYRKSLQKVLDELGMKKFMKMESQTLRKLETRKCVIAPGGSAVYYPLAMQHLKKLGPKIYLEVSLRELKKRIPSWDQRGVVCRGGHTLDELYRERVPLYQRYADITISCSNQSTAKVISTILKKINHGLIAS
jgi:shikimate kinase